MNDLLEKMKYATTNGDFPTCATMLRLAAARIRQLEAEVQALKQDRADVCGTIGKSLGLPETTPFSKVCMDAWDFIRFTNRTAGSEDPIALIEAAKKLPMTADGVRVTIGMDVWVVSEPTNGGVVTRIEANGYFIQGANSQRWVNSAQHGGVVGYSTQEAAEIAKARRGH